MTRTIALTGGARGIGAATLERLEAQGCAVFVLDQTAPQSTSATHIACDLTDEASIVRALDELPTKLSGLVNVAGVATLTDERHTVAVNFLALRMITEQLLPRIDRGGSVVNVASTAGWKWQDFMTQLQGLLDTEDYSTGMSWLDTLSLIHI